MPKLNDIVGLINQAMQNGNFSTVKYSGGRYLGIADYVRTQEKDTTVVRPAIVDNEGKCTNISIDDKYPFTIYHIVDDQQFKLDDYGKPGTGMYETAPMHLVFLGDRKKVKLRPEEIVAFMALDIPKEFTAAQWAPLNLTSAVLEIISNSKEPYTIWNKEFSGVPFAAKPQHILCSISYRIVTSFNKKCYTIC